MRAGVGWQAQWDGRETLGKSAVCLGTLFSGRGEAGSGASLVADRAAEGCDAQAVSDAMQGLSRGLCRQQGSCLLLHLSGAWRDGAGKGDTSYHARIVLPHPCLGLGKPQPRSTWCSPEQEPQTLLSPSWPLGHLKLGCKLTQANTAVQIQQDEGTFQLQFTSRKRGLLVTGLGHTVGERWCSAWRRGETQRTKTWSSLGFEEDRKKPLLCLSGNHPSIS